MIEKWCCSSKDKYLSKIRFEGRKTFWEYTNNFERVYKTIKVWFLMAYYGRKTVEEACEIGFSVKDYIKISRIKKDKLTTIANIRKAEDAIRKFRYDTKAFDPIISFKVEEEFNKRDIESIVRKEVEKYFIELQEENT